MSEDRGFTTEGVRFVATEPAIARPLSGLRFVQAHGAKILQQAWEVDGRLEWRAVPLVVE